MQIVDTDTFWEYMQLFAFTRIGFNKGIYKGETIYTAIAPEHVPGYINEKLNEKSTKIKS